jgi:hypothetical protein
VPTVAPPGARVLDLANSANSATDVRMAAEDLDSAFAQNRQAITWLVLAPTERAQLRAQVRAARDRAATAETTLRNAANVIVNIDATQAAVREEAALIARTLAKIRKAEADRAAEAARRAAAALEARAYAEAEERAREERTRKREAVPNAVRAKTADPTAVRATADPTVGQERRRAEQVAVLSVSGCSADGAADDRSSGSVPPRGGRGAR